MAKIRYVFFRGKRVSAQLGTVLEAAEDDGVRFILNSGNRSMSEQQKLVDEKGLWTPQNQTGAARPSSTAPHIRVGKANHALDVDTAYGGNQALARYFRSQGIPVSFPIAREPWHMDPTDERALKRAAKKLSDPLRLYPSQERNWIRQYDSWFRRVVNLKGRKRLRADMRKRAGEIRRAARPKAEGGDGLGWTDIRRRRYASLNSRSK